MSRYSEPSSSASVDGGVYSAGPSETTTVPPDSVESDRSSCAPRLSDLTRKRKIHCNPPPPAGRWQSRRQYLALSQDLSSQYDPLLWWKNKNTLLPTLAMCVRKVLCIQPSSAAAESVFIASVVQ